MNKLVKHIGMTAVAAVALTASVAQAALIVGPEIDRGDFNYYVVISGGTGNWTVPAWVSSVEVLVVGGGGSSANPDNFSSGAGAGGYYYITSYGVIGGGSVSITVGDGGVGQIGSGGNSVFEVTTNRKLQDIVV